MTMAASDWLGAQEYSRKAPKLSWWWQGIPSHSSGLQGVRLSVYTLYVQAVPEDSLQMFTHPHASCRPGQLEGVFMLAERIAGAWTTAKLSCTQYHGKGGPSLLNSCRSKNSGLRYICDTPSRQGFAILNVPISPRDRRLAGACARWSRLCWTAAEPSFDIATAAPVKAFPLLLGEDVRAPFPSQNKWWLVLRQKALSLEGRLASALTPVPSSHSWSHHTPRYTPGPARGVFGGGRHKASALNKSTIPVAVSSLSHFVLDF